MAIASAVYIRETVTRRVPSPSALVVPLIATAVITAGIASSEGPHRVASLTLGAFAGIALLARRRAPRTTLAVTMVLTGVLMHLAPGAGVPAVIAPAVALYSLAVRSSTRMKLIAAVVAMTAVVAADALHQGGPTLLQTLGHVLLVALPLLIADLHRVRHANLRLLEERLELADAAREREGQQREQRERLRIARDLHDVVAHTLTTINVQASTAAELLERNPEHAKGALETIEQASRDAIEELRAVLGVLRDGDAEASRRPTPGLADVAGLVDVARADGASVDLRLNARPDAPVPNHVSVAAYRIIQESLTNARRHAAGSEVTITLDVLSDRVRLSIANPSDRANGLGGGAGVGIYGMRERAALLGGHVRIGPLDGTFRVEADLPYASA